MSNEVKAALAEMKQTAHKIGIRGLSPYERKVTRGDGGGFQSSSHFDVDEFLERQKLLEGLQKDGSLEELLKA